MPNVAHRLGVNGEIREVKVEAIVIGDFVGSPSTGDLSRRRGCASLS
jgi:hypothetical protein